MADIGASNVTYIIRDDKKLGRRRIVHAQVSYGNAALTYPDGGIPLTTSKFALTYVQSVEILESNGSALIYEWDRSANTIRMFNPTQETNANTNKTGVEFVAATTAPAVTALEVEVIGY